MNPRGLFEKLKGLKAGKPGKKTLAVVAAVVVVGGALGLGIRVGMKKAVIAHGESGAHEQGHSDANAHASATPIKTAHERQKELDLAKRVEGHKEAGEAAEGVETAESGKSLAKLSTYVEALKSVQERIETLRHADEENQKLRLENANLKLKVETIQFNCRADYASKSSNDLGWKLDQETGTKMGRTLAALRKNYEVPTHLLPVQLFTLAASYFKAREDEKAAIILTHLTGLEEDDTFKNSKNFLMTGIAWYRIDNLNAAKDYFERVLKTSDGHDHQIQGQARLWMALVSERQGKHGKSQEWLREVLNNNPHSTEAAWVNSRETERGLASATEE